MKKIYNYIFLSVWALASVCCSDDEVVKTNPLGQPGDEVQFGLTLSGGSRTIYGTETTDGNGHYFPIYWVNGDKVQILSPQCSRNNAEYQVTAKTTTQNFADELSKTGAYGVQWGSENANFYSVYPSGNYTISADETKIENLSINTLQELEAPDANGICNPKMTECLMFAKALNQEVGKTVDLTYTPIATSLRVTLTAQAASDANTTYQIQAVTVTAQDADGDVNIVGDFSLNLATNKFSAWMKEGSTVKASNIVRAIIGGDAATGYHTMNPGETITLPLFIAPQENLNVKSWKVMVYTDKATFTKTLNVDKTLAAGQVHELVLPTLSITDDTEWDVSNWMVNIPRNVYLSEVSIPGTWNSLNQDCQNDASIDGQYSKGVRAFHIDTRWKSSNTPYDGLFIKTEPTGIELSVAIGGSDNTNDWDDKKLMKSGISNFASYLKQITDNVKSDEYMVVFCTFAQNSYNGNLCPSTWMQAISDVCDSNTSIYNGSNLNDKTVVNDVLNNVIVIVNLDVDIENVELPENSKCLFTYIPMLVDKSRDFSSTSINKVELYKSNKESTGITLYNSHSQLVSEDGFDTNDNRGYAPTFAERDNILEKIITWSKDNYKSEVTDHWLYMGLGGYVCYNNYANETKESDNGYLNVETHYNTWINEKVSAMGNNNIPYYPVGIILMNNNGGANYKDGETDLGYGFTDVVKNILLLNNKYRLQYDPNKPAFPTTAAVTTANYDATATSGGNVISLD